jgi:hypothetical protein
MEETMPEAKTPDLSAVDVEQVTWDQLIKDKIGVDPGDDPNGTGAPHGDSGGSLCSASPCDTGGCDD